MANLTAARDDDRQEGLLVDVLHNSNKIFAGGLVTVNTNGYAKAGASGERFIGVAMENTPTDREYIRVWTEGVFQFDATGMTQGNVGDLVTVGSDDHTVKTVGDSDAIVVGKIINVISATSVRVKIGAMQKGD